MHLTSVAMGISLLLLSAIPLWAVETACPGGASPSPDVIWCDSFEDADLGPGNTVGEKYYDFDDDAGDFIRINTQSAEGNYAMRSRWQTGETSAGSMHLNFGRNPLGSNLYSTRDFRDIYWRFYIKLEDGFSGYPSKLTRAIGFADTGWSQSMIAHLWVNDSDPSRLAADPASGIAADSSLATSGWNDFANLSWLGARTGSTALVPGQWYCVEAHVALNSPGNTDGVFEYWLDDTREAGRTDLNWVKSWTDYGINAVFFSNYWGAGSPREQERYFDALVVSTKRIGCIGNVGADTAPAAPTGVSVRQTP